MRILLTTRGSAGHVTPLVPFGHAALRARHEVLVATQGQHVVPGAQRGVAEGRERRHVSGTAACREEDPHLSLIHI